jgi:hypothetical protein
MIKCGSINFNSHLVGSLCSEIVLGLLYVVPLFQRGMNLGAVLRVDFRVLDALDSVAYGWQS